MKTIFRFCTGILIFFSLTVAKELLFQNLAASASIFTPHSSYLAKVAEVSQSQEDVFSFDDVNFDNDLTPENL